MFLGKSFSCGLFRISSRNRSWSTDYPGVHVNHVVILHGEAEDRQGGDMWESGLT